MAQRLQIALVAWLALAAAGTARAQEATPAAPALTQAECEVWERELGFARAVADHDAEAFAEHLDPGAAFESGQPEPLRGRERITAAWADVIAGRGVLIAWYPSRVTIGGAPDVAWSSGPALFEWPGRPPAQRHAIGTYHSVWRRGADGQWRVLFDEGAGTAPASAEAVARFRAQRPDGCPAGDGLARDPLPGLTRE